MKSLRYVSAQPATLYYAWQVEVMVNNFIKHGVAPRQIHIVCAIKNTIPTEWIKLQTKYNDVGFFFYEDTRVNPVYVSSVRPHILKKHFAQHSYLESEAIFYHDCDIVLTQPVTWEQFLEDDVWYLSNTVGYIGAKYIKGKKYGLYERMCEIIGIDQSIPEQNEQNSGGAQYIMKNIGATFWDKVEQDSEELYKFFMNHLRAFPQSPTYHPIQMWTSDMWAVLWNAWYFKHETKVVKEMDFLWPGHALEEWKNKYIFHNAGVIVRANSTENLFFKGNYIDKLPYGNIKLDDLQQNMCTVLYAQEIIETGKVSCLL